jgi:hypothetical protein
MVQPRITGAERDRRIAQVLSLLASGLRTSEIYRILAQEWGASSRTADRYIKLARAELQVVLDEKNNALLAEAIAHRRDLRRRARAAGDFRMELEVAKDEAKLLQLYPAERQMHEHSGPGGGPLTIAGVRDLLSFPEDDPNGDV